MRFRILALLMLLGVATAAPAQVNIGVNFSLFPDLVRVPDYPVYYAPRADANYFFYDGMYWVFRDDQWYSSDWYNGPWYAVSPEYVPLYVWRIPVRYYRRPPSYFRGWGRDAPPRWGQHWGRDWEQQHSGWDRWNRRAAPAPAPLPTYQRQYSGNKYPRPEERHAIQDQKYRYQPKDAMVREHVRPEVRGTAATSAPEPRKDAGKDARDRDQRKDAVKDTREPPRKDAGKDVREPPRKDAGKDVREPPRKDFGKDTRDQRPAPASPPPAPKSAPVAPPPAARERQPEPPRKDAGRETREREQRPPPQPAAPREPPRPQAAPPRDREPPPRPAAPPPPRPAAPPPPPRPAAPPPPPPHPAAPPPPPRPAAPPPQPHPQAAPPGKGPEKGEEHK